MSLSVENQIYTGTIIHKRFTPCKHGFNYPIFMTYFDISKTDKILKKSWLWHPKKPSILSFNRSNYHGDEKLNLDIAVRETAKERLLSLIHI